MHRLLVLYPEPDDRAAFTAYYTKNHLPLAQKLPGLVSWSYSTDIAAGPEVRAPYFALFEADFASRDAFTAAMESPEGRAVAEDVPNYATQGAVILDFTIEGGSES